MVRLEPDPAAASSAWRTTGRSSSRTRASGRPWGGPLYFTIVAVAAETVLGVAMALLFNREFWGRGLLRTLAILPMVATPDGHRARLRHDVPPDAGGRELPVSVLGLPPFRWTYSSQTALYALALVDVWQWTPLIMLIALAGLASLPREPYEAAHLDGASTRPGLLAHHAAAAPPDPGGGDPLPRRSTR